MVRVETFSEGKVKERNEDRFAYSDDTFVIVDGATDKSGRLHDGKTGGEIVAELVSRECLSAGRDGTELVRHLNKKVREKYIELGILEDTADPKFRFMCDFVQARIVDDRIVVTYVGELGFRVNGSDVYKQEQQIDIENAERRAKYIAETGDIAGSRERLLPYLLGQFEYQNVSGVPLGYGVIDGTETPDEYVKTFEYSLPSVRILELFTDGYFLVPEETTPEAWEQAAAKVEAEDPDKWRVYKATKSKDDRTVAIIRF